MKTDEYCQYDGVGLAGLVRDKQVTARELATTALSVVSRLEPQLSALIDVFRDDVDSISQDAVPQGPFAGVPFIIKDCVLMMKGKPVANGSRLCEGARADHDTDLMKRFRQAGVTCIGLSKCPEFGYNGSTEPVAFGPTHSPWQLDRSPGGSSGGSAAAVAAGYVPLAHGNDGGGSIRIPASCCGVVGLKPTRGRNPLGPDFGEALFGMSVEGVLSRTVRDTAHMLDATAGPGSGDPYEIPRPDGGFAGQLAGPRRSRRIAFAIPTAWTRHIIDPEVCEPVRQVAKALEDLGHQVNEDYPRFDLDELADSISHAWVAGETAWIQATAEALGTTPSAATLERVTWNIYREGQQLNAVATLRKILNGFNNACRRVAPFFERHDFLVTPTLALPPPPLGYLDQNADLTPAQWWDRLVTVLPFTPLFNVTGQPAISLPLGMSSAGLPIGVQIIGRYGDEAGLIGLAAQLEDSLPWRHRHPPVSIWQ